MAGFPLKLKLGCKNVGCPGFASCFWTLIRDSTNVHPSAQTPGDQLELISTSYQLPTTNYQLQPSHFGTPRKIVLFAVDLHPHPICYPESKKVDERIFLSPAFLFARCLN